MNTDTEATSPPSPTTRSRRLRRGTVAGLAILLIAGVVAGLVALVWWWRHPDVFYPYIEDGQEQEKLAGQVPGRPAYFGSVANVKDKTVQSVAITDAQPHILRDDADARIRFYVCTLDPHSDEFFGTVYEAGARKACLSLTPAIGTTMRLNSSPRQEVVMSVEMRKPGAVEVQGVDLTYRDGRQHGTQRVGSRILVVPKK